METNDYALKRSGTGYVELPVTGGYVTKVDPDIADILGKKKLTITGQLKNNRYPPHVRMHIKKKGFLLSRFIMKPKPGLVVDHISGDHFDNRRCNLRVCSQSVNQMNHIKNPRSKSGFWGVSFDKKAGLYYSRVCCDRKIYRVGYFRNLLVASLFRDDSVKKFFRLEIGLNFPFSINQNNLSDFLNETKGRIFKVSFIKRSDGLTRTMLCRNGVSKFINRKGMSFKPSDKNLYVVYDMIQKSYKCIPLENILCIRFKKKNYRVIREAKKAAS
ncbi:MAG: hypothetical protein JW787_12415 [Sedimentisphaerales bacterium]|nr:hypothetical protein [Sedimentisphaerales bacterium]